MLTFDELVARLRSPEGGGFNVSPTRAGELVNQAIRRLAVVSEWIIDERELGPTVAGQDLYDLPDVIAKVKGIKIAGDPMWARASTTGLWDLAAGNVRLEPKFSGAFAQREQGEDKKLGLWPTPGTDGLSIIGLVALTPAPLSGAQVPPFPDDAEDAVQWFAKAIAYEEIDEDLASAQGFRDMALGYAGELKSRNNSRIGSGVVQAQIAGVHF